METQTEKMKAWTTPEHVNCFFSIEKAVKDLKNGLAEADAQGHYPSRIRMLISDVEKQCYWMKEILNEVDASKL